MALHIDYVRTAFENNQLLILALSWRRGLLEKSTPVVSKNAEDMTGSGRWP